LIVANSFREEGAGFQTDTNVITMIDGTGRMEILPKMTKIKAAEKILDRVLQLVADRRKIKK
jgi:phosphopantothenoylcysteine decarboxylase / phosphopantothenate---cysteine ligase